VAVFDLSGLLEPAVGRLGGDVRHLYSAPMSMDASGSSWVGVTEDSVVLLDIGTAARLAAWPLPVDTLAVEPAPGDLDGDGRSEMAFAGTDGRVSVVNGDGSPALGWPQWVPAPVRDLKLADLDGDQALDVLVLDGAGRFQGYDGRGKRLDGYPRPLGPFTVIGAALEDLDAGSRGLTWVATAEEGALVAMRFPEAKPLVGDWRFAGGRPERWYHQTSLTSGNLVAARPEMGRPLLVYPNPARGDGVEIRFLLAGGETAKIEIVNAAGRPLTDAGLDFRGGPQAGENAVRWDLHDVAPGLYFCRLARAGSGGSRVDLAKIVVVR
jgi:hypothetical protein